MRTGPVGVAVIGAGNISDQYLSDMIQYPDLDVRVVAARHADQARRQAGRYDIPSAGSVSDALARDDVELVVNITAPDAHAEVAHQAIGAGKHVWNEKPLATTRAEGYALVEHAESVGVEIGAAPDTVLGPGIQTARRWIERGDIGRPLTASVVMQYSGPHHWHPNPAFLYQTGAGPLLDTGPYYVTALIHIFGPVRRVVALGAKAEQRRTIGAGPRAGEQFDVTVPTYVGALLEFGNGAVAQATFSFDSHLERQGVLEISGTTGLLTAPDPNLFDGTVSVVRAPKGYRTSDVTSSVVDAGQAGRGIGPVMMARTIRSGSPNAANGRVALHVLDTLLSIEESIDAGGFVKVTSDLPPLSAVPPEWDPTVQTLH